MMRWVVLGAIAAVCAGCTHDECYESSEPLTPMLVATRGERVAAVLTEGHARDSYRIVYTDHDHHAVTYSVPKTGSVMSYAMGNRSFAMLTDSSVTVVNESAVYTMPLSSIWSPGIPSIVFDGTSYLLVEERKTSLLLQSLSEDGSVGTDEQVPTGAELLGDWYPAQAASDGTGALMVSASQLYAVSPSHGEGRGLRNLGNYANDTFLGQIDGKFRFLMTGSNDTPLALRSLSLEGDIDEWIVQGPSSIWRPAAIPSESTLLLLDPDDGHVYAPDPTLHSFTKTSLEAHDLTLTAHRNNAVVIQRDSIDGHEQHEVFVRELDANSNVVWEESLGREGPARPGRCVD